MQFYGADYGWLSKPCVTEKRKDGRMVLSVKGDSASRDSPCTIRDHARQGQLVDACDLHHFKVKANEEVCVCNEVGV